MSANPSSQKPPPDNTRPLPPPLRSPAGGVLSVYHMGRADVGCFAPFSHFGTLNAAFERMIQKDVVAQGAAAQACLDGTVFYAVQLRLQNPLVVEDDFTWNSNGINNDTWRHFSAAERQYVEAARALPDHAARAELTQGALYEAASDPDENRRNVARQRMVSVLEAKGYDGIAYINRDEDSGSVSWVNFRPQQVESVYSGPMTDKPCVILPKRPRGRLECLAAMFGVCATAPGPVSVSGLSALQGGRLESTPETIAQIADHFAAAEARWCAEQDMREQQFRAEIAIALYDPEYVAARVCDGDTGFARFYERCQQRMSALAAAAPEDMPAWQRAYLPDIKRAAGVAGIRAAAAQPGARPLPPANKV